MSDDPTARLVDSVCAALRSGRKVRRKIGSGGQLYLERQLPFLCVNRMPTGRDDPGIARLLHGEPSYLIASGAPEEHELLGRLVEGIAEGASEAFGGFFLLECWSGAEVGEDETIDPEAVRPEFVIHARGGGEDLTRTIETLQRRLARVRVQRQAARARIAYDGAVHAPGMPGLLSSSRLDELNAHCLGLEVQPVFRNLQTGEFFPLVWRTLHRDLSHALRRTFFAFTQGQTTHRPPHYHALGRRAVTKAVWEIDGKLAGISDSFDFLLQVSPINTEEGWRWFKAHRFEKAPVFHYRPLPIDPPSLKGQLYRIDLDRIEDPSLGALFRDKRAELDRQLTMLLDRDTRNFFYGSLQLYGPVDERTRTMAEGVLGRLPGEVQDELLTGEVAAEEFAQRARAELDRYRAVLPEDGCEVIVTGEVAGLMVSKGCLLVSPGIRVPADRVEALIEHEVGTHILTWQNARQQRFRLLASGLADYDELQEGLAVLAEYLCGGLTAERMRLLAGRVVACHHLQEGATFIETYRRLVNEHNFERRTAYRITTRVYRGGGLMKDAVYFRGLVQLLDFLGGGGDIHPLLVGKIATRHIPIVEELTHREVLQRPPLLPGYLEKPEGRERLAALAGGVQVSDLVSGS